MSVVAGAAEATAARAGMAAKRENMIIVFREEGDECRRFYYTVREVRESLGDFLRCGGLGES